MICGPAFGGRLRGAHRSAKAAARLPFHTRRAIRSSISDGGCFIRLATSRNLVASTASCCGLEEFGEVPGDEADLSGALAHYCRIFQIAADRDLPRSVDELARRLEEAAGNSVRPAGQAFPQRQYFRAGDRHPFAVDWVEAAQSVAKDQQTLWETAQL
jgi:hypothetical protein